MNLVKEIDLGHSKAELFGPDIVRIEIKGHHIIAGMEAMQMTNAIGELSGGREMMVLILAEDTAQFDRTAREFSASPAGNVYTKADALVVKNLAQRLIANFYIKFNKPVKPCRVFNSEEDALAWFESLK